MDAQRKYREILWLLCGFQESWRGELPHFQRGIEEETVEVMLRCLQEGGRKGVPG